MGGLQAPGQHRVRVARRQVVAQDIMLFELVCSNDGLLPSFSAGSHIDVHIPGGLTRQYSLCNDPQESHRYLIAVLRSEHGRGGSRAMHELIGEGDALTVSLPRNHFPMSGTSDESLLLAGGIGITPLLSMAESMSATRLPFTLHYCTRSPARTAFREHIRGSSFADRVIYHFNDGPREQMLDLPRVLASCGPGTHLYTCGPNGFMDAVLSAARTQGWPEARLHREFFNAALRSWRSTEALRSNWRDRSRRSGSLPAKPSLRRFLQTA